MHTRLSVCLVLLCTPGLAQQAADLTQLSVDDLAKIQVTSASKKAESLSQAPAAIYVLTGEAIREGGFATLPEALRTVPGLYVVQTNSHSWQLSTRGFSGIDNRKMLVLVDGRSVYCPIFGGVFWDLEDIPLENIDWSARAQQTAGEYQVEAAYLYNFAKTARWPAEILPDRAGLIIGVLGGDEDFVKVLRDVLAGKDINGHAIEIRYLRSPEEVKFCHVVFSRAAERTNRAIITQLGRSNVLLVGQNKDFLNDGGMINLTLEDGKITYKVNAAAFERAGVHYGDTRSAMAKADEQMPEVLPESSRSIAFRVVPEYPRLATSMNLAGAVQLQAIIRADGTVKQVKVIGGHPVLAEAAATAVRRWRYEVGPRETTETVRITFGE